MQDPRLASPANQKYLLPAVGTVRQPAISAAPGSLVMQDFCSSAADADKISGRWPGLCLPWLLPESSLRRIGTAEPPSSGSPPTCPLGYGEILAAHARAAWVRGCLGRGCQQRESLANHALGQAGHEGDLGDRVALVGKLTDDPHPIVLLQSARTAWPRWRGISRGACRWTRFEAPHSRRDHDKWQMRTRRCAKSTISSCGK